MHAYAGAPYRVVARGVGARRVVTPRRSREKNHCTAQGGGCRSRDIGSAVGGPPAAGNALPESSQAANRRTAHPISERDRGMADEARDRAPRPRDHRRQMARRTELQRHPGRPPERQWTITRYRPQRPSASGGEGRSGGATKQQAIVGGRGRPAGWRGWPRFARCTPPCAGARRACHIPARSLRRRHKRRERRNKRGRFMRGGRLTSRAALRFGGKRAAWRAGDDHPRQRHGIQISMCSHKGGSAWSSVIADLTTVPRIRGGRRGTVAT